jgi:ACT domain-containing protein
MTDIMFYNKIEISDINFLIENNTPLKDIVNSLLMYNGDILLLLKISKETYYKYKDDIYEIIESKMELNGPISLHIAYIFYKIIDKYNSVSNESIRILDLIYTICFFLEESIKFKIISKILFEEFEKYLNKHNINHDLILINIKKNIENNILFLEKVKKEGPNGLTKLLNN